MQKESTLTAGKKFVAYGHKDPIAVAFAKRDRLRKLPRDDDKSNALIVNKAEDKREEGYSFKLTLRYGTREMKTDYSQGSAHLSPPEFWSVLHCLLSDISGIEDETFEDWCSNYGMDTDSREAEKIFNACRDTLPKLRKLLGTDFDRVRALEEEELMALFADVPTVQK